MMAKNAWGEGDPTNREEETCNTRMRDTKLAIWEYEKFGYRTYLNEDWDLYVFWRNIIMQKKKAIIRILGACSNGLDVRLA